MCLAVPAEILSITNDVATCRVGNGDTTVTASLMVLSDPVTVGDYVIIHAGFAINRLDPKEAKETLQILRDVMEAAAEAGLHQDSVAL